MIHATIGLGFLQAWHHLANYNGQMSIISDRDMTLFNVWMSMKRLLVYNKTVFTIRSV